MNILCQTQAFDCPCTIGFEGAAHRKHTAGSLNALLVPDFCYLLSQYCVLYALLYYMCNKVTFSIQALADSGVKQKLIHQDLAEQL